MEFSTLGSKLFLLQMCFIFPPALGMTNKNIPLVVITWDYLQASQKGNIIIIIMNILFYKYRRLFENVITICLIFLF